MANFKISKNFVIFCIIGGMNFLIYIGLYYVFLFLGINYIISTVLAYAFSILNAYLMNKKFVFSTSHSMKKLFKVYVVYLFALAITTFLMFIFVDVLSISQKVAPILVIFITTPINYLLNKNWGFK